MRSHVSGVLPNALESRIAISGLMPDLPLITLLSACRVTPRTFAPAVTESPRGSRQALRMLRPGCGKFFMGIGFSPLVIVDQSNIKCVAIFETKDNSPIPAHGHRPKACKIALEWVQTVAGHKAA